MAGAQMAQGAPFFRAQLAGTVLDESLCEVAAHRRTQGLERGRARVTLAKLELKFS